MPVFFPAAPACDFLPAAREINSSEKNSTPRDGKKKKEDLRVPSRLLAVVAREIVLGAAAPLPTLRLSPAGVDCADNAASFGKARSTAGKSGILGRRVMRSIGRLRWC
jgi:hypothetical protein